MNTRRKNFIIKQTRLLLNALFENHLELFGKSLEVRDLFPLRLDILIRDQLKITYEEPAEFSNITLEAPKFEVSGFIQTHEKRTRIVVPQSLKPEWRRFTVAHEVGHLLLHAPTLHHHHRPLTGGERANLDLPPAEHEANLFAAYLLMPKKPVSEYFEHCIGNPIDGREPDPELAFWLGTVARQSIDEIELVKRGADYRALLVAQLTEFKGLRFVSLADRFGVSASAMGYQLIDLELVK